MTGPAKRRDDPGQASPQEGEPLRARLSNTSFALPSGRLRRSRRETPKSTTPADEATNPTPRSPSRNNDATVKARVHGCLLDELSEQSVDARDEAATAVRVDRFVQRVLQSEDSSLNDAERERLANDLHDETLGVGPLAPLLADPAITDVLVVVPDSVFVEKFGRLEDLSVGPADEPVIDGGAGWVRFRWLTPLPTLLLLGVLLWFDWPWPLAAAVAFLAFVRAVQAKAAWAERRERIVERQLSETLDMMVASVKVGSAFPPPLESTRSAVGRPLRGRLNVLIGRIRFGDAPQDALQEFSEEVPLETVRLFSQALTVVWPVEGKLSETLANVGRTGRDRDELTRRATARSTSRRKIFGCVATNVRRNGRCKSA